MSEQICEMPDSNSTPEEIKDILNESRVIAVVGLSTNSERDSYKVAQYLMDKGYEIIPVNPAYPEILGQKSYERISDIPVDVDIVDIFRKPEFISGIVDEAIEKKAKSVWMQLGLADNKAAEKARGAGLRVVQNKCIKIEHHKMDTET